MDRREFNKDLIIGALATSMILPGCQQKAKDSEPVKSTFEPFFKLSLAQWSLHKAIKSGQLGLYEFASKAKSLGFEGVEYVSSLYYDHLNEAPNYLEALKSMTNKLNESAKENDIKNLLIMVDDQGDLGTKDKAKRLEGVEMHHKWIDMAHATGCHSIRINLFGDGTREEQFEASRDSMRLLGEYAKALDINVIVENHGGHSSDPTWVKRIMKTLKMPNVGTLPDFGNFCIEREGGARWDAPCINEYQDYYQAVKMMMPYAKAVSAKSYKFDEKGNETKINYLRMLKIVKDAGYTGFIGVEFEGEIDEEKGIIATRDLLIKAAKNLQGNDQ